MNWSISISLNCHRLKSVHLDEITQNHGKIHSILNLKQFTSSTLPVCLYQMFVKLTKQNNFQSINTYTDLVITATRWKVKARNISTWTEIQLTINRILKTKNAHFVTKHILWQKNRWLKKIVYKTCSKCIAFLLKSPFKNTWPLNFINNLDNDWEKKK